MTDDAPSKNDTRRFLGAVIGVIVVGFLIGVLVPIIIMQMIGEGDWLPKHTEYCDYRRDQNLTDFFMIFSVSHPDVDRYAAAYALEAVVEQLCLEHADVGEVSTAARQIADNPQINPARAGEMLRLGANISAYEKRVRKGS